MTRGPGFSMVLTTLFWTRVATYLNKNFDLHMRVRTVCVLRNFQEVALQFPVQPVCTVLVLERYLHAVTAFKRCLTAQICQGNRDSSPKQRDRSPRLTWFEV
ncbi:hypothetical protein IW261DRAFT_1513697 [Armillaria novae-zelandiae]|uniref:Secreted protein n=1 Tax=Armillaria novae-zelandiae TaxID=153914 RepID=A0AA39NSJ1_9AGAR|nr:hypothetical protein IW261DRAFT_1513697 [Armillaria novae-zelandiae]